jgi:hypothetical protein
MSSVAEQIQEGEELDDEARSRLLSLARTSVESLIDSDHDE